MKSNTNQLFTHVNVPAPKVSSFDLNHDLKMSCNMGLIIPTMITDVLPGDIIKLSSENFLRLAPLVSPVMHKINVTTHTFFVPNRIIWAGWEDFITGTSEEHPPYIQGLIANSADLTIDPPNGWVTGSLADYLGIPPTSGGHNTQKISALPLAAYYKIYDEYYRDQNLIDEKFVPLVAGDNSANYLQKAIDQPLKRAWQHDYFTACLPFAQKGDTVTIPLLQDQSVPVQQVPWGGVPQGLPRFTQSDGSALTASGLQRDHPTQITIDGGDTGVSYNPSGTLVVELNEEAASISALRKAFRMQEFLEKDARTGTRYTEFLRAHFNVRSSDARIQRPEYVHGSKQNMVISEVLTTAETEDSGANVTPTGNMAGHGISVGGGNWGKYRAEEHGYLITVMNIQPETSYSQGLHRSMQRFDRFDYAFPEFANIGEQAVLTKEVRNDVGLEEDLNSVFGYIPRYAEYKYMNSRVAGDMRAGASLNFWHMAREFEGDLLPTLSEEFIECDATRRIFAYTDESAHQIYCHIFNNLKMVRKLPKYGTPTI